MERFSCVDCSLSVFDSVRYESSVVGTPEICTRHGSYQDPSALCFYSFTSRNKNSLNQTLPLNISFVFFLVTRSTIVSSYVTFAPYYPDKPPGIGCPVGSVRERRDEGPQPPHECILFFRHLSPLLGRTLER